MALHRNDAVHPLQSTQSRRNGRSHSRMADGPRVRRSLPLGPPTCKPQVGKTAGEWHYRAPTIRCAACVGSSAPSFPGTRIAVASSTPYHEEKSCRNA